MRRAIADQEFREVFADDQRIDKKWPMKGVVTRAYLGIDVQVKRGSPARRIEAVTSRFTRSLRARTRP